MSKLLLKTLTCNKTAAPIGAEQVKVRYWKIGEPNIVHFIDADALAAGDVYTFDPAIPAFEFEQGAHVELSGNDATIGGLDVGAGLDMEFTANVAAGGASYTLRYVVLTLNKNATMIPVGKQSNGVSKTAVEDCHIGGGAVSCARANLIVEVRTPEGDPIAGATVYLELQNRGPSARRRLASGVSDAYGNVDFDGIDPGDYFVIGSKRRHTPAEAQDQIDLAPAENATITLELTPPSLYFGIYYVNPKTDADRAFERAAKTWESGLVGRPSFRKGIDATTLVSFTTKAEFQAAWASIQTIAQNVGGARVKEGHVFSHGTPRGIEFTDGTLTHAEIPALPVLKWESDGELELLACRAGTNGQFSTAAAFAQHQGVKTTGFDEYGLFSSNKDKYQTIKPQSKDVYLKSYEKPRSSNCLFWCDGKPNDAQVYYPPVKP